MGGAERYLWFRRIIPLKDNQRCELSRFEYLYTRIPMFLAELRSPALRSPQFESDRCPRADAHLLTENVICSPAGPILCTTRPDRVPSHHLLDGIVEFAN